MPYTRAVTLRPVMDVLARCGAAIDRHLIAARIDPDLLERPEAPVPLFFAVDFVERAARAEGIDDLGLLAADRLDGFTELGAFSARLAAVPSAAAYLTEGARLLPHLTSGARYALRRLGDGARFHIAQPRPKDVEAAHGELYAVLATINTLERFAGRPWRPVSLRVPRWCRIGPDGRERLGIDRIRPDGDDFSFPVPAWLLARAVAQSDRAQATVPPLDAHPGDLAGGVRVLLDLCQPQGEVSLTLAAEAAGMSPRTLQRRLLAERTSFARLAQQWRLSRARGMLLDTTASVVEIATALGYGDASNFARAFRAYAGCAPTAFRTANAAGREAPEGPPVPSSFVPERCDA